MKNRYTFSKEFLELAVVIVLLLFNAASKAQESFNVYGNRFEAYGDYNVQSQDSNYLIFGTKSPTGITCMNFSEGDLWSMQFFLRNGTVETALYGTSGTVENDSVFLILARMGTANTAVIKATVSGRVIWANWYNTGTDEHPDKIVKLRNGDYLVSVRTNVSYYEFGEWGSRAGVMRIGNDGSLKWFRILDKRSLNTYSLIRGMHETNSGNIILMQDYQGKMGLITLKSNGDSLRSLRTTQDIFPRHSAYDAGKGILYVVTSDRKLMSLDSASNWLSARSLSSSNLNSLNQIILANDTTLIIGGDYQNKAAVLQCDTEARVRIGHTRNNNMLGLYPIEKGFISLIRQGYMINRHKLGEAPSCFSKLNAGLFSTSSVSVPSWETHVPINGSATWDAWDGIFTVKSFALTLTPNCLSKDLKCRTEKDSFQNTCPQFAPRLYLTNNGQNSIMACSVELRLNGALHYRMPITLSPALGAQSSAYASLPQVNLPEGLSLIEGVIYAVDGTADEYMRNNSFRFEVRTRKGPDLQLNGPDSVCPDELARFELSGAMAGNCSWYRNLTQLEKQGSSFFLETSREGQYHVVLSDSGCLYYSDTLRLSLFDAPAKPSITFEPEFAKLSTDALPPFIWFLNEYPIDTSSPEILAQNYGWGNYHVVARNEHDCETSSDTIPVKKLSTLVPTGRTGELLILHDAISWTGKEKVHLKIYSPEGRLLCSLEPETRSVKPQLVRGIYLFELRSASGIWISRVLWSP